jgi:hypothetical protein
MSLGQQDGASPHPFRVEQSRILLKSSPAHVEPNKITKKKVGHKVHSISRSVSFITYYDFAEKVNTYNVIN